MAHELDRNTRTGRLAYFGVKETPWHGEGFTVDTPPSFDEALRLAGADYDVELRPILAELAPGMYLNSPTGQAVIRMDRTEVLGVVGDAYTVIQNREAFEVLTPLIDSGVATIETGGTLREGADAWLLVKFDVNDPVVREVLADEVVPYALVSSNHTGRRGVTVMETPIRVVCANTLGAAHGGQGRAVNVRHRANGRVRLVDAANEFFAGISERYVGIAQSFAALKSRILTVQEFTASVLDVVAPLPTDEESTRFGSMMDRAENRRDALTLAWTGGKGHVGDHSAWEAYNAAVEVLDHDAELFKVRGSRVASLISGPLHESKTAVLNALVTLSK